MPHELNGVCLRYTVIVIDCTAVQCRFTLEEDYGIGRDSAVTLSSKAVGTILLHYSLIQAALVAAHASAAARYSSENLSGLSAVQPLKCCLRKAVIAVVGIDVCLVYRSSLKLAKCL